MGLAECNRAVIGWWDRLVLDLSRPPEGPRFRWFLWVVLPSLLLAAVTILIRVTEFDLTIEKDIFRAGGDTWQIGDTSLWAFLYHYGTLPAVVCVLAGVLLYILSWSMSRFRRWRKVYLFAILMGVIGAGVVANAILKEYWGRPRPREVLELGGHERFEKVLHFDPVSDGKSFPCGHATMGFYFMGGFFLLRRHRRRLAWGFLIGGLVMGLLIGIARMAQGAHFASDVFWSAGVCWFVAVGLDRILRLDKAVVQEPVQKKLPLAAKIAYGVIGLVFLLGVILATPYQDKKNYLNLKEEFQDGPIGLRLILTLGNTRIVPGDQFLLRGEAWGHGLPTSRIRESFMEWSEHSENYLIYKEVKSGWFTEINEQLYVEMPWERTEWLELMTGEANLEIDVGQVGERFELRAISGTGEVRLKTNGLPLSLPGEAGKRLVDRRSSAGPGGPVRKLILGEDWKGTIIVLD